MLILNLTLYGEILNISPYTIGDLATDKTGDLNKTIKKIQSEEEEIEYIFFNIDFKDIKVSSELNAINNNSYAGKNIIDFNTKTAWVEGVKGDGIGEWIEINYEDWITPIRVINFYNGYCKNEKTWKENGRVKKIKLYVNNRAYAVLNLKDTMLCQGFCIDIGDDVVINKLKFEILEVYKGEKYEDTAISEILFEYHSCCFPATTKISLSDNLVKTIDKIKTDDEIITYNSADNKFEKTKVISVAKVPHNNLVEINFGDRVITSTDDHPYLSENGWKSCNMNGTKHYKGYESLKELKVGDKIYFIGENGKTELKEVKGIKKVDKKEMCYTITKLENGDNFIADGAVVGVEDRKNKIK